MIFSVVFARIPCMAGVNVIWRIREFQIVLRDFRLYSIHSNLMQTFLHHHLVNLQSEHQISIIPLKVPKYFQVVRINVRVIGGVDLSPHSRFVIDHNRVLDIRAREQTFGLEKFWICLTSFVLISMIMFTVVRHGTVRPAVPVVIPRRSWIGRPAPRHKIPVRSAI